MGGRPKKMPRSRQLLDLEKMQALLKNIGEEPYITQTRYQKLIGDLAGTCLRRVNIQQRLGYEFLGEIRTIQYLNFVSSS